MSSKFQPKISTGTVGENLVWRWHLPDGKTPANGVVAKKPIEQCLAEYIAHLATFFNEIVKSDDVQLPSGNGPKPVKRSNGKRSPASQPIQVGYGSRVHESDCVLLRDHIGACEGVSALAIDLPPINVESAIAPTPQSTPHRDVLLSPVARVSDSTIVPFYAGAKQNPFYQNVLAAVSVSFADSKATDTVEDELLKDAMNNELCEMVPAMNDWNRAGVLADEVVTEFNAGRNYVSSQEGPKLWEIVQRKVNLLLTELRADTELRLKRAMDV